jgi:hypothetical protein
MQGLNQRKKIHHIKRILSPFITHTKTMPLHLQGRPLVERATVVAHLFTKIFETAVAGFVFGLKRFCLLSHLGNNMISMTPYIYFLKTFNQLETRYPHNCEGYHAS